MEGLFKSQHLITSRTTLRPYFATMLHNGGIQLDAFLGLG